MVSTVKPQDFSVTLKFGGGITTRPSPDEVDPLNCASGKNFLLDLSNHEFRNRPGIDLVATAPGGQINGYAQLQKVDGTISTLVQSGTDVYSWDGASTFNSVGTVTAGTKLRGPLSSNWPLTDKVIITDLGFTSPVMEWDGTTFQEVAHNLTGDFIASYCHVAGERAYFGRVSSNGTATKHVLVGSKVSDYANLTVSNRPSSTLGADDPFFVVTPDLRPINGLVEAFGQLVFSTQKGKLFYLTGSTAKDFAVTELFPRSAADGDEAMVYVGNDILYGRQGRIESLIATDQFGDVESNDLTKEIADAIDGYGGWTSAYNSRLQRAYWFADTQAEAWVFHKPLYDLNRGVALRSEKSTLSPWSKWTSQHAFAMQPTAIMTMLDPIDGLEKVYAGDSAGRIYRLEGSSSGDGGSADITCERLSKLFSAPLDAQVYDVQGWIKHRRGDAARVTIKFEYAGASVFDEQITIDLPAISDAPYYNLSSYYGGSFYNAPFQGRLVRQPFGIAGQSNEFQIRVTVEGTSDFQINEVAARFKAAA